MVDNVQTTDDIPRRERIERLAPAERLIRSAALAVAGMGNDPKLSQARELLQGAATAVADYIDATPGAENGPVGQAGVSSDTPQQQVADPDFLRRRRLDPLRRGG